MSTEIQNLAEADSAPATEVTATTELATNAPEVTESSAEQPAAEKLIPQSELDAMIGKRLARERRKWEREQQAQQAEMQVNAAAKADVPPATSFESPEAYAEALAERRARELISQRETAKQQAEIAEAYADKEEEVRAKYDDFEQVAYNPNLPITTAMAETIRSSEIGPELAYHLGQNPKEAERIAKLTPFLQAKEIGRIEAKLVAEPPVKKTSSAPAPISPVTARASGSPALDTTDPRSTKTMSTSEWIEAERQRQVKKQQALRNR